MRKKMIVAVCLFSLAFFIFAEIRVAFKCRLFIVPNEKTIAKTDPIVILTYEGKNETIAQTDLLKTLFNVANVLIVKESKEESIAFVKNSELAAAMRFVQRIQVENKTFTIVMTPLGNKKPNGLNVKIYSMKNSESDKGIDFIPVGSAIGEDGGNIIIDSDFTNIGNLFLICFASDKKIIVYSCYFITTIGVIILRPPILQGGIVKGLN